MVQEVRRTVLRHGLSFYATVAFVAGFFGARSFATLNPRVVVVQSGIHFHHFWYGLAMVILAGWLGIALSNERLDRTLALVFGLGAGFVGDEVGLLLTFDNYQSQLTEGFFVGAIAFIILATLLMRFGKQLEKDVFGVSNQERLTHTGIFLGGFSTIFFAFGNLSLGLLFVGLGATVFLFGFELERRPPSLRTLAS